MGYKVPAESEFGGAVEEGNYKAKLTAYYGPKQGKWGDYIDFEFTIVDNEDYPDTKLSYTYCGVTSQKFKNLVAALSGGEYDEDLDLDDAIGTKVRITVEEVEKTKDGEKRIYSNITRVKAVSGGKAAARPAPKRTSRPVDDEDDDAFEVDEE